MVAASNARLLQPYTTFENAPKTSKNSQFQGPGGDVEGIGYRPTMKIYLPVLFYMHGFYTMLFMGGTR